MPDNDLLYYDNFNRQLAETSQECPVYEEEPPVNSTGTPNENDGSENDSSYQNNSSSNDKEPSNGNGQSATSNDKPNEDAVTENTSPQQQNDTSTTTETSTKEDQSATTNGTPNENETTENNPSYNEEVSNNNGNSTAESEPSSNQNNNSTSQTNSNNSNTSSNSSSSPSNNNNSSSNGRSGGGNQSSPPSSNSNNTTLHSESSYTSQVATNWQLSVGKQLDGITNALNQPAPNATAKALNVAEAGIQAFGMVAGLAQNLVEGAMLPIFAAFGMKGMASLPVSKQMDPVMGIDIHMVTIPPSPAPIPMPHPYVGMLFKAKDFLSIAAAYFLPPPPPPPTLPENPGNAEIAAANFAKALALGNTVASIAISMIGATVAVGTFPRVVAGTPTKSIPHFPMGTGFHPSFAFVAKNNGHAFMGSMLALADDDPISGGTPHMHLDCNDVGIPSPHTFRPSKNKSKEKEVKLQLFLPTGMITPIPPGKPVLTNPLPIPFNPISAIAKKINASFGRFLKKSLTRFNHNVLKKHKSTRGLSNAFCKLGFEPVDLITGRMIYEGEDFSLPGPIPVTWKRVWYSDSPYDGMMGHGVHCNYDVALHIEREENAIVMRLPDGRVTSFPLLVVQGESTFNRHEKFTLTYIDGNTYEVYDKSSELTYTFIKLTDDLFKPVTLSNAQGFQLKFFYNGSHLLNKIIDCAGRKIHIELDFDGRVTQVHAEHKDKTRKLVNYEYDGDNNLVNITDALGKATVMEYENHLMLKKTDRNGQAFYWKYDGKTTGAKCVGTWGDEGILAGKIQYKDGYNIVTNSLEQDSIYYFNDKNLCTQVTDPLGNSIYHKHTPFSDAASDMDEEGNLTGYTYDSNGNLTAITQPDGTQIVYDYDDKDHLIATNYPEGGSVIRTYDEEGKLQAVIGLDENITSFAYNEIGLIEEVRDANGNETLLEYDEDFNLTKMTLPNNAVANWEYDEWGRCVKTINNEGHEQQFFYDELDRIQKIQQADINIINLQYNAYDEVVALKDKQRNVNFEYTPLGSLKTREENGVKVHFKYDTEEDLQEITNEHSEKYNFNRNQKGEIITESGFDGLTRFYNRDKAGKVIKVNRPGGKFTEYEYDLNGKITRAEHSDGSWETFTYNRDGLLVEAANQNSLVELMRDPSGRIIKEIQNGHEVESTYDKLGNRIKITSSLGADIDIERDDLGLIKKLNAAINQAEMESEKQQAWTAEFKYNSLGMEVERLLPGGVVNTFEYDKAGRPISQQINKGNRELRHRTYKWNVNDRLTTMVNQLTSGTVNYTHDDFGSLASAQYEDGQMDYKLPDEVGNLYRTEKRKDREYGPGGQLLRAGDNRFRYDEEGNLVEKETPEGDWEYNWFGNGMLKSVHRPDGEKVEFEYDSLGRRTAKIVSASPFGGSSELDEKGTEGSPWVDRGTIQQTTDEITHGTITRFIWDGNVPLHEWAYHVKDRPNLAVNELGFLTKDKEEPISPQGEQRGGNTGLITWVFDEGTFKPAAKVVDGEQYSIITDYLGTPVEMYNSLGEKTWQAEYDIYGKIRKFEGSSLSDCPFRYQGQYEDEETGLYYNRFRYYSADEGVYVSQDPIGLMGGMHNFYSYVIDSNILVDILGLHHSMTGEVVRNGNTIFGPEPFESGGFTGAGSPNQQEALLTHTERHFINTVEDDIRPGDHLRMTGKLNPCRPGCQPAIRRTVNAHNVTAEYRSTSTGEIHRWAKHKDGYVNYSVEYPDGTKRRWRYNVKNPKKHRRWKVKCKS